MVIQNIFACDYYYPVLPVLPGNESFSEYDRVVDGAQYYLLSPLQAVS
jgi:hypothetical protein